VLKWDGGSRKLKKKVGSELRLLLASCAWEDPSFIDNSRGGGGGGGILATRKTCSQKCFVVSQSKDETTKGVKFCLEFFARSWSGTKRELASLEYGYGLASE